METSAEQRLQRLITANDEANRKRWVLQRKEGGKVIGLICPYVPEEIVLAAGCLPYRVTGTWGEDITRSANYRAAKSCPYCNHVLESLLSGELDFLDGVLATSSEQDIVRLYDMWVYLKKPAFAHIIHLPHQDSDAGRQYFANGLRKAIEALGNFTGREVTDQSLAKAIKQANETRDLISKLYQLRKLTKPALTGAEVLGITTAATIMPREEFNRELAGLLPYLEKRQAEVKPKPRLLVSSVFLDDREFLREIEGAGGLVAMDSLDTGSRYFFGNVNEVENKPVMAIARRYLSTRPASERMLDWGKQLDQTIAWVREFNIDGVVELRLKYSRAQEMRAPFARARLEAAGIPNISLERDYHLTNTQRLKLAVQAFVETLEARK